MVINISAGYIGRCSSYLLLALPVELNLLLREESKTYAHDMDAWHADQANVTTNAAITLAVSLPALPFKETWSRGLQVIVQQLLRMEFIQLSDISSVKSAGHTSSAMELPPCVGLFPEVR